MSVSIPSPSSRSSASSAASSVTPTSSPPSFGSPSTVLLIETRAPPTVLTLTLVPAGSVTGHVGLTPRRRPGRRYKPSGHPRQPRSTCMHDTNGASRHGDTQAAADERRLGLVAAGTFGFGFSGLVDVLVLHHVLQWHHLVSGIYPMDTLAGLRTNILADGLFSLAMLVLAGIGAG